MLLETDKIQETLVIRGNKLILKYSGVLRARASGWKDERGRVGAARPDQRLTQAFGCHLEG